MVLFNSVCFAIYLTLMLVDHYTCISKTSGTNVTLRMEILFAVGMCILVLEMINAHVVLILARETLIKELNKWGILAQCELLVYRISFSLDLFIKHHRSTRASSFRRFG